MAKDSKTPEDPESREQADEDDAEARAFVMARRAKFVAAALAGAALVNAACSPEACLTPPPAPNEGYGGTGGLFPPQAGGVPVTGGTGGATPDAGADAAPSTGGVPGTGGMPVPCLSMSQSVPDPKNDGSNG